MESQCDKEHKLRELNMEIFRDGDDDHHVKTNRIESSTFFVTRRKKATGNESTETK